MAQFVVEAREQLQAAGDGLLQLETAPGDASAVDAVFRSLHTVKGGAGLFQFPALNRLLHETEQVLHALRGGELRAEADTVDLLLDAVDQAQEWIEQMAGQGVESLHAVAADGLLARLEALLGKSETVAQDGEPGVSVPADNDWERLASIPLSSRIRAFTRLYEQGRSQCHLLSLEPDSGALLAGQDPLAWAMAVPGFLALGAQATEAGTDVDGLDTFRFQMRLQVLSSGPADSLERIENPPGRVTAMRELPLSALLCLDGDARPLAAEEELLAGLRRALERDDAVALEHAIKAGLELFDRGLWVHRGLTWLQALQELEGVPLAWKQALVEAIAVRRQPCLNEAVQSISRPAGGAGEAWELPDGAGGLFVDEPVPADNDADMDPAMAGFFDGAPGLPASSVEAVEADPRPGSPPVGSGDPDAGVKTRKPSSHVNVDAQRLDELGELVGELIVARNGLPYLARRAEQDYGSRRLSREIKEQGQLLERVTGEIQRAVSAVQMQPVSTTFQRFRRLTRDIARKLDKQVTLVLEGEQTQADRQVLAAMVDPLTHLVRNSLDHGIEPPAERRQAGKPETGRLVLRARHAGDWLELEVADDGRGLDPEAIAARALDKGVVSAEALAGMDTMEKQRLIFAPGFSTAEAVSEVSGRGVGMDAVKASVESLGGCIGLDSQPGEGSRVTLSLPLSMAVSRVLLVRSGAQDVGIPIEPVVEIVRRSPEDQHHVRHQPVIMVREQVLPVMSLGERLGTAAGEAQSAESEVREVREGGHIDFVILDWQSRRIALRVDAVGEDMEVVAKPLEGLLKGSDLFSGHSLLGDGRILFILDMKGLMA
ncbi:chemotaxis protein CheA [Gammaproteobacteria bacterium AB-CW1]|uniref:Chemotaxis protein CheA n=1 Tax=Natronospira elongata TaxID=3110268 RepID=A0AAP6MM48_9GAMM|nr:chemotaxis protein CheA [Gammaproteobacteria bacterium AB-CW1]